MTTQNEIIDHGNLMTLIRMLKKRDYEDPFLLLLPIQKQFDKKSKKRGLRKSLITSDDESSRRKKVEETQEQKIFFYDSYKRKKFYDDYITPLFPNYYFLMGDCLNKEEDVEDDYIFDSEKYEIEKLILITAYTKSGFSEVTQPISLIGGVSKYEFVKQKLTECFIVTIDPLTSPAMKFFNKKQEIIFSHFQVDEIEPPNCIFGSKYRVLNDDEAKRLIRSLKTKKAFLPKLQTNDPIIKYYGYRPGTIVEVTRKSIGLPTLVDSSISYAVVIQGNSKVKSREQKHVEDE